MAAFRHDIEINEQFQLALDVMEKGDQTLFITGKAGTGKSTLLQYFRSQTHQPLVVLAPTGVAAVNINGQTIHSFFGFKPSVTLEQSIRSAKTVIKRKKATLYRKLKAIIIDEISMVRADLMDCVDQFLRVVRDKKNIPFGGVRLIFFGDLYQLPPVLTSQEREIFKALYPSPYFFEAHVFKSLEIEIIELEKIYRQKEKRFIDLLGMIRNNTITEKEIDEINARFNADYELGDGYGICLTTTNKKANEMNESRLAVLPSRPSIYQARIEGDFEQSALPTATELFLKKGAQIMLLNNDSLGRWINGTIGRITSLGKEEIEVELENGIREVVEPVTWELFNYTFNRGANSIETEVVGSFTQIPVRLAWAVTIHKSQGKTFDHVVIDFDRGTFASGQAYVALSRCTSLAGVVLKTRFLKRHIFVDQRLVKFMTGYHYQRSEKKMPLETKLKLILNAIAKKQSLQIVYLKAQDVKSERVITPQEVGKMVYANKPFIGVRAFCHQRKEDRTFRVDRILELMVAG